MVCIHFSIRSEAISFYKSAVTEQKLWCFKEFPNHIEVTLEHMDEQSYTNIVQAFLRLFRKRKLRGWVEGVLKHCFYYEDQQEIQRILELGREFEDKTPAGVSFPPINSYLQSFVRDYIYKQTFISFDNLSADCLKHHLSSIIDYTGKLIDEYKLEETHQLLVDSWRRRVHKKDTGVQVLHLVVHDDMNYFHAEGNKISRSETLLYMQQYPDQSISDLPLKWNITPALVHAPDHLFIYSDAPGGAQLELLMNIFEEKATWKPLSDFPFTMS